MTFCPLIAGLEQSQTERICKNCFKPEHVHEWRCTQCARLLPAQSCGCENGVIIPTNLCHGSATLCCPDEDSRIEKDCICPVCGKSFKGATIINTAKPLEPYCSISCISKRKPVTAFILALAMGLAVKKDEKT